MGSDPVTVVKVPPYWGSLELVVAGDDVVAVVVLVLVVAGVVVLEPLQDTRSVIMEMIHNNTRVTDFILITSPPDN